MSTFKKSVKASKFVPEDINEFINESHFLKDSPKAKKGSKRQRTSNNEEEDISKLIGQYQVTAKKKKATEINVETCKESRQKLLEVMSQQLEARKNGSDNLLKSLAEILSQMEADYNVMKDNEQKLEHLTGALLKCMQQATNAHKQKFKAINEIHKAYKKDCEEMENDQKVETEKLADELEEDIKKLQQKLVSETKRSGWEALRRSIFTAMQNDF